MIWVVTNNQETRQSLIPLISSRGYTGAELPCGDDVLRSLRFQVPSLFVIDCGMPGSFETLAAIRSQPRARSIPVVMFSDADANHRDRALLQGANAFVSKGSLDWDDLLVEILRFAGPSPKPPPA